MEKEYFDFMYNRENIFKCENCPENRGEESGADFKLPCGQQNCWVVCHCERRHIYE